jgi:hypothetical protein
MTPELQRAMARYEEARFQYRRAILTSLNGASNGEAIQQAIRVFQTARAELKQLEAPPPSARAEPKQQRASSSSLRPQGWGFVLRLLKAG